MTVSAFVFYVANIALLTVYLVIAGLVRRPGGLSGTAVTSRLMRFLTTAFFVLAAALHADMAWHAVTLTPFFSPPFGGRVAWDFALIVLGKAVVALSALVVSLKERKAAARE